MGLTNFPHRDNRATCKKKTKATTEIIILFTVPRERETKVYGSVIWLMKNREGKQ